MPRPRLPLLAFAFLFLQPAAWPQSAPTVAAASAPTAVPPLVPFSGMAFAGDGKPLTGEKLATFVIYKEESGGEPLWLESQTVSIDSTGHFKVQLGAASPNGLPGDLFATGEARWLEVQIAGQPAQGRVLLASVPYALKAGDAATLGGLPASAYALAGAKFATVAAASSSQTAGPNSNSTVTTPGGTTGYLPLFTGAATIADSQIFDNGTDVGIGTATPTATLDVVGTAIITGGLNAQGGANLGGSVNILATGNATASAGKTSQPLAFVASSYNSSSHAAVAQIFRLEAEPTGNDTASPSGTLNLLFGSTPAETGLYFNPNGTINFAPGQTFPGTGAGTITGVTAGTGLTGGGTSGAVTLNLDTTKVPLLHSANSFTGNQAVTGNISATGSETAQGPGSFDTSGTASVGLSGIGIVSGVSGQATGSAANSAGVLGTETSPTGVVFGVAGATNSTTKGAAGVGGEANALTGQVYGVAGTTSSTTASAAGVSGLASATTGNVFGVYGESDSTSGYGVAGNARAASGFANGVYGLTASPGGDGVVGENQSTTGGTGVRGIMDATTGSGYGVFGTAASATNATAGVQGYESAATGQVFGVSGTTGSATDFAAGVSGSEGALTGRVFGVAGATNSATSGAAGVSGNANALTGTVYGVYGGTSSATANAAGVDGFANSATGQVYGVSGSTNSTGDGAAGLSGFEGATTGIVFGVSGVSNSTTDQAAGINASEASATGNTRGLNASVASTAGYAVYGDASATTGFTVGVFGDNHSTGGVGVYGKAQAAGGIAGGFANTAGSGYILLGQSGSDFATYFSVDASGNGFYAGNLNVTGKLTKGSGSFKIDDPLDPANKYLSHSFVESPDMMNVYNGNVTTDKHGRATVELPEYFEALNRDFRYQLTVMGQFAQAIVAQEIGNNRFVIRTSKPSVKVSWQVTGIRKDAYANANRIPVEEEKPAEERGYYLHPEVYGQPASKGIVASHRSEGSANEVAPVAGAANR